MNEAIVHGLAVAGGAAGKRVTERIVAVGTLRYKSSTAAIYHASEQIALRFIALRERHVIGHHKSLQQVRALYRADGG